MLVALDVVAAGFGGSLFLGWSIFFVPVAVFIFSYIYFWVLGKLFARSLMYRIAGWIVFFGGPVVLLVSRKLGILGLILSF